MLLITCFRRVPLSAYCYFNFTITVKIFCCYAYIVVLSEIFSQYKFFPVAVAVPERLGGDAVPEALYAVEPVAVARRMRSGIVTAEGRFDGEPRC